MKRLRKQQLLEQSIYGAIWTVIFLLPLIGGYFAVNGGLEREESRAVSHDSWLTILPFFVLFLLNNYVLVPYFLFRKRYWPYIISVVFLIAISCLIAPAPSMERFPGKFRHEKIHDKNGDSKENRRNQLIEMRERARKEESIHWDELRLMEPDVEKPQRPGGFPKPAPYPFPPFTIRYLIHFVVAFLMVGFNIAVKLFFKSFRDEEMLKELEHQHLQSELQYLKYQINPHFFMNTLNNIHALVDIDTGKAKSTIVELSKLMRYVLYEASNKTILLSREIQFLENYVTLMSLRYPDRVSIEKNFPLEVPEVQIPPLLFVSFVENAFKHGISYRKESFVHVVMQLEDGNRLSFRCTNSTGGSSDEQHHGIGLENVRKRLRLLFGNDYTLSITEEDNKFDVLLIVPLL